jgi:transaldolase/glucose-6-phosphate isomerase
MSHREEMNPQTYQLPPELEKTVNTSFKEWRINDKIRRLWSRDPSLWTGADEGDWLGWLDIVDGQLAGLHRMKEIAEEMRGSGFSHILLLGMGGSSLCPEVMERTFGRVMGFPKFYVLDSTDPAQIRALEGKIDLSHTIFIVSSKSGTTLEPNLYLQYFLDRVRPLVGEKEAGNRFIAITDPDSKLQEVAERNRFRRLFFGLPTIGGRYSALSDFGMIPSAMMGVEVTRFLDRAKEMVQACGADLPVEENPGAVLGTCRQGRDKVTILASPDIYDLGAWLEQLLAESTGKSGKGLIPVDRERPGPSEVYGNDRLFVYIRLESSPDPVQDRVVDALEGARQPVIRILLKDRYHLGQEFFRWEFATAVAGSILQIHPFDQPDVETSKIETRKLTAQYERTGELPSETPLHQEGDLQLFTDPGNAHGLTKALGPNPSLVDYVRSHINRLQKSDYFALLGYVEMTEGHEDQLQAIRHLIRDKKRVATCLGFGPRFLHSTGQAYKGGPNSGVFVQITCEDSLDLPVPGQKYSFGMVKAAQARGDFQVLTERGRRALRVHLRGEVKAGLARLGRVFEEALANP